jgi:hypothetical protein
MHDIMMYDLPSSYLSYRKRHHIFPTTDIIIEHVRQRQGVRATVLTQCTSVDIIILSLLSTALHIFVSLRFPTNGFEWQCIHVSRKNTHSLFRFHRFTFLSSVQCGFDL